MKIYTVVFTDRGVVESPNDVYSFDTKSRAEASIRHWLIGKEYHFQPDETMFEALDSYNANDSDIVKMNVYENTLCSNFVFEEVSK